MDARTSPWQGRRVLVTGCTGFLGRAVTRELLDRGAIVAGLVRDPDACCDFIRERATGQFWTVYGRVEDRIRLHSAMAVHEVSAVFHMASAHAFGNDRGTESLFHAAGLYHPRVPVVVARPEGQLRLITAEEPQTSQPVGIARFGELFGGGERMLSRVVPRTVRELLKDESITLTDSRSRDFVFVRDAARACLLLAQEVGAQCESRDFTFRSGWERNDQQMAALTADIFAGNTPAETEAEKTNNPLGWQPSISLNSAIAETIVWYREAEQKRSGGLRTTALRKVA
ncbi:MAG: NAD(P)-dependent oxidoreductase [Planctomycetes bacterium]|nr:NAD(P)-dependent oxidoreductase [Planctomycetota bacterium]